MPIILHFILLAVSPLIGPLIGTFVGIYCYSYFYTNFGICNIDPVKSDNYDLCTIIIFSFIFLGFIMGALIPIWILKYLLYARCPKCGSKTIISNFKPITYKCTKCGHSCLTPISLSPE